MNMNTPYVFIIAGGSGTRLWPVSRKKKPKQLLKLASEKTLIEDTLERALSITKKKYIFIGTNQQIKKAIQGKVKWLKKKQFIVEPEGRNTAPIISLFCARLQLTHKDLTRPIVVLAADHFISPTQKWSEAVISTFPFLNKKIFCMGILPHEPNTGYGYIETTQEALESQDSVSHPKNQKSEHPQHKQVKRFTEKPDLQTAKKYIKTGCHFWNSGIFIFSAEIFLRELKIHSPDIYEIAFTCAKNFTRLKKLFLKMPDISIDYALIEKTRHLGVVVGFFQWDDVGSFLALERVRKKDSLGNIIPKHILVKSLSSQNNIIFSEKSDMKFALLGAKDLVIAYQNGVCLIAHKDTIHEIKKLRELFPKNLL